MFKKRLKQGRKSKVLEWMPRHFRSDAAMKGCNVTVCRKVSLQRALAYGLPLALAFGAATSASAQDLRYQPVDPSFGGNPFNSAHLLGVASAQNNYKDPASTANNSQAQIFANQLQSRLLSALSSQIVDAIFGANPQQSGTITFGGQTIHFDRGTEDVTLTITDDGTGAVTTIVVPTTIVVN